MHLANINKITKTNSPQLEKKPASGTIGKLTHNHPCQFHRSIQPQMPFFKKYTRNALENIPKKHNACLPDMLKTGIENLSGTSMDDVRIHYNSSMPAQFQALAYTQGTEIHIAPGQEKCLPHEAWHVVQQKQGRVSPNMQMRGMAVNDDMALEREADMMGKKAASAAGFIAHRNKNLGI